MCVAADSLMATDVEEDGRSGKDGECVEKTESVGKVGKR